MADQYRIVESQLPLLGGLGGHNLLALLDANGNVISELDGLASTPSGEILPIGFIPFYHRLTTRETLGGLFYDSGNPQATLFTGSSQDVTIRWNAAVATANAISSRDLFYPPLGFGDNSNSVASTLIRAMGFTEPQLPGVPFYRFTPGTGISLLDDVQLINIQQTFGILPSTPGSSRAVDFQSAVNNPDGSVSIFTSYRDGTSAISHYRQNGFEETLYGVDGASIGSVKATSSASGKVSVNISGQVGEVNLTNATVNIAPDATVAFTGSLSQIYAGNNSTVQATVFNSTITTSSGVKLTTLGTNDNVLINGNNNLVQNSANLSTIATGSGLNNSLANLGSNNNLILGTGTTVDMLGNNNTVIGRVPSGRVFDQGTGNQSLGSQNLPLDVGVDVSSSTGFEATIGLDGFVDFVFGGFDGGYIDDTFFPADPDPESGGGGGGFGPDPLINGHSFIISGDITEVAGDGNNSLEGGVGTNRIIAGNGDNYISAPGVTNTVVVGDGNNNISASGVTNTVALGAGQNEVFSYGQNATIVGGTGNDLVFLGLGNNTVIAGSGPRLPESDTTSIFFHSHVSFVRNAYANVILGPQPYTNYTYEQLLTVGDNRILGGDNGDLIAGGFGNNTIIGGAGNDRLFSGGGDPLVNSDNFIYGGGGDDIISGSDNGTFGGLGGNGNATIYGGDGNDTTTGVFHNATIYGEDGNDTLGGTGVDLVMYGGVGDDVLANGGLNGTMDGGLGNDTLIAYGQQNTIIFGLGSGHDTVVDQFGHPATIKLGTGLTPTNVTFQTNVNGDVTLSFSGTTNQLTLQQVFYYPFEVVTFSDGTMWTAETILNMTPGLVLSDTTGGQVLQGSPLADTLSGAGGNDTLAGGVGNDTYLFNRGYGRETISDPNYITGLDQNIIRLGGGIAPSDVTLQTNVNGDLLLDITGTADQLIIWSYFNDPVYRAFDVNFTDGTSWDANMILSQASGMVRTDTAGGQFLQGSPLADTLSGAGGNDTLAGGAGDDTYLANLGYGTTTITDSSSGNNRLVFGPGIDPSSLTLQWDSQSLALVVTYGNQGDRVLLSNFDPYGPSSSLAIQNFQFADGTQWDSNAILDRTPGLVLTDTAGGAYLQGSSLADTLSGAGGNDTLIGGPGNDTYLFDRGYGLETIIDQDESGHDLNTIRLAPGITPTDVTLHTNLNGDLLLNITGTADQLVVSYYFSSPSYQAEQVTFADGTIWGTATILSQTPGLMLTDGNGDGFLQGSPLADTLSGGSGNDYLAGGAGSDTYLFALGDSIDTIQDNAGGSSGGGEGGGGSTAVDTNTIVFGQGIAPESVNLAWDNQTGSLLISYGSQGRPNLLVQL